MTIGGSSKKVLASQMDEVKRICALIVDDDPIIRKIHTRMLNKHGLETQSAKNGKEAVDLFNSGNNYDLVLMDKEMPVMDGLEATRELRGMGVTSMIVGVTARALDAEKEAFMEAGLDVCWEKPLSVEIVINILDELAMKLL